MTIPEPQRAVSDFLATFGIPVPDTAYRVQILCEAGGPIDVEIHASVVDPDDPDGLPFHKTHVYEVTTKEIA